MSAWSVSRPPECLETLHSGLTLTRRQGARVRRRRARRSTSEDSKAEPSDLLEVLAVPGYERKLMLERGSGDERVG